jgi:hypothetical protein
MATPTMKELISIDNIYTVFHFMSKKNVYIISATNIYLLQI